MLLVAGILKSHSLVLNLDRSHNGFILPIWALYLSVVLELLIGVWLLTEPLNKIGWLVPVAFFALAAIVSFYQWQSGSTTCGCFGALSLSPRFTFFLDCSVLTVFLVSFPGIRETTPTRLWAVIQGLATAFMLLATISYTSVVFSAQLTALFPAKNSTIDQVKSNVGSQLYHNLRILFSPANISPVQLTEIERVSIATESVNEFVTNVAKALDRPNDFRAERMSFTSLRDKMVCSHFEPPIILVSPKGGVTLLLGMDSHSNAGEQFIALKELGPPKLLSASELEIDQSELWEIKRPKNQSSAQSRSLNALTADRTFHLFDMLPVGSIAQTEFTISNFGESPLQLNVSFVSCSCVKASLSSNLLESNQGIVTLKIVVEMKDIGLRQRVGICAYDPESGGKQFFEFDLLASTAETFVVIPSTITFTASAPGHSINSDISFLEKCDVPFIITGITRENGDKSPFDWAVETTVEGSRRRHRLSLRFPGEIDFSTLNPYGSLRVHTSCELRPFVDLQYNLRGSISRRFPPPIGFGVVGVGTVVVRKTKLRVESAFALSAVESIDKLFRIVEIRDLDDFGHELVVEFTPVAVGIYHKDLYVSARRGTVEQTITIKCFGEATSK